MNVHEGKKSIKSSDFQSNQYVLATFFCQDFTVVLFQVKMTVQGEAVAGTILQQTFVVEYVVNHQMCDDCRRVEAKDLWNANVSEAHWRRCTL